MQKDITTEQTYAVAQRIVSLNHSGIRSS
jgi:hypothetical protein